MIGLRHFAWLEYASEKQIFKTKFVAGVCHDRFDVAGPTGTVVGAGFVQHTFLAQIKAAFFELSLLRLCPPLPNHETGQNGLL